MVATRAASEPRYGWVHSPREALAGLTAGKDVFGLFRGEFSLLDLIVGILDITGTADVIVSTWTAAIKEIQDADKLLHDGRIRSIKWLVDFSFPRRQPGYCRELVKRFGHGSIRVTKSHAKFVTVRNDTWNVVLRTSANLNRNPRFEFLEISNSEPMADFLEELVDMVWRQEWHDPEESRPMTFKSQFIAMARETRGEVEASDWGSDLPGEPGMGGL